MIGSVAIFQAGCCSDQHYIWDLKVFIADTNNSMPSILVNIIFPFGPTVEALEPLYHGHTPLMQRLATQDYYQMEESFGLTFLSSISARAMMESSNRKCC